VYQENPVVQSNWVVYLDYRLTYDDGEVVMDSEEDGRLSFIQGRGHVFPIIEGAAEGMHVGDEMELQMSPEETYGLYDEDALELLPFESFPEGTDVCIGLEVELFDEDSGEEVDAIVIELTDDGAVVDMNHPLAGELLTMWFRVSDLRPATDEELSHDHVHADDEKH